MEVLLSFIRKGNRIYHLQVTRHANGEDGLDASTMELLRAKMPEANPAKVEQVLSTHIQRGTVAAAAFVGGQTGFSGPAVMATLETKSSNARATFLRAVVSGWDGGRVGRLSLPVQE